ncbi:MAG: phage minor capsid protein [Bacillaceae bacterium]|nr:phage minor capsid protein [Bacillaceae bacterium]
MSINSLDKESQKLVKDYKDTYIYVLNLLQSQIDKGLSENQARSILREIQLELQRLDEEAYKWSYEVLPEYYYLALSDIDKDAALLRNVNVIQGNPIVMHRQAIMKASRDTYNDLAKNTTYMSQEAKKIIRGTGSELITRQIISGDSYKKTKKDLKDELVKNGVSSFIDAGKKEWKIGTYSSMMVRTKSRILHSEGTFNRLNEYQERYPTNENFDLVQISNHNAEDWCRYFESTIWSLSGRSDKYPHVEQLPNGYSTLHPNCLHVFLPYMVELRKLRGNEGRIVSKQYLNRTIKDLNREDYHLRKAK